MVAIAEHDVRVHDRDSSAHRFNGRGKSTMSASTPSYCDYCLHTEELYVHYEDRKNT